MVQDPLTRSHRALCDALKHRRRATVPELTEDCALNAETVREHLRTLTARKLIRRDGTVQRGRGRPEIAYVLTPEAESLFPRREGEVLHALGRYLVDTGQHAVLNDFFAAYITPRREAAKARVAHLTGRKRLREVERIMREMGFMPVVDGPKAAPQLRLCHCPLRDLVEATDIPCRAEIGLLRELLDAKVERKAYIPNGDLGCDYELKGTP